jgi:flagellar P-ring protein precursor FlgI
VSIQDLVKIAGQNASPLRGMGIVTGLAKTGDSGAEMALARPLAQVYQNNGMPLADVSELAKGKSAAVVSIWTEIPEEGGRAGDRFDVFVQTMHSAGSLRGGSLLISPLLGPLPSRPGADPNDNVYGFAWGPITIEETDIPTVGRIRNGCQLRKDLLRKTPGQTVDLIVRPHFRSMSTTRMIASEINGLTADLENSDDAAANIAEAMDDTLVRVVIPEHERRNPTNFLASLLTKRFSPSLIDLPAQVIVNDRTGTIIVTGDVEISAVTIGNDQLVITTTTPPPSPTALDPLVSRTNWAEFGSTSTTAERARIQDLLEAFRQLNVPVKEQIEVLAQINQTGRLHARFIRD